MKNVQQFPAGWDAERVRRLISELDARSDEEWVAADTAVAGDDERRGEMRE